MSETQPHLWEVERPCSCEPGNYHHAGLIDRFKSWPNFLSDYTRFGEDVLLFRWDWEPPRADQDSDDEGCKSPIQWQGDENYRDSELSLFWVNQNRGCLFTSIVDVCRADEENIRRWLQDRYAYMLSLWAPFPEKSLVTAD